MDSNSFLVWWLLIVPIVLAIVDRFTMAGGTSAGAGRHDPMRNGGTMPRAGMTATTSSM